MVCSLRVAILRYAVLDARWVRVVKEKKEEWGGE
jgi:hypothetical protein